MGTNTLNARSAGQIIVEGFFNDFNTALQQDFVGRDSSGVPASGQNLGTAAFPWGAIRANSLILLGSAVDTSQIVSPVNRIVSGKKRTTSNQMQFLTPNGGAASVLIAAASTNLVVDINGAAVTVNTDITKSSLTLAPSSSNTALVNDADAAAQEDTRLWGEYGHRKTITMDAAGSNITALVGKWAAFKAVGTSTEYLLAYVNSTTELTKCYRGFFYDSSLNPVNRTKLTDNDVLTLMKLTWIFVENDGLTVDVTYNNPVWDYVAPGSPVTGDYWYDLQNSVWKRYDGASFQIINRTFIGMCIQNTSATVAARCNDFYANYKEVNTFAFEVATTEIVRAITPDCSVNVYGQDFNFYNSAPQWNITVDLATSSEMYNASEQASTVYYCYLSDKGQRIISDISPYWRPDLKGWYHPHNTWREIGVFFNDSGSDIVSAGAENQNAELIWSGGTGHGGTDANIRRFTAAESRSGIVCRDETTAANGSVFTVIKPGLLSLDYLDLFSAGTTQFGASKNSTQLTTSISNGGFVASTLLGYCTAASTGNADSFNAKTEVKIGDKIRAHTSSTPNGSSTVETRIRLTFKRGIA